MFVESSTAPGAPLRVASSSLSDVVVPTIHHTFKPKLSLCIPEAAPVAPTVRGVSDRSATNLSLRLGR